MLFPDLPRDRPRIFRMKIADGGVSFTDLKFTCPKCGYDDGWKQHDLSITEIKRGIPCPVCNKPASGEDGGM